MYAYNGLGCNMSNLSYLSNARSYSISPENHTGAKNGGGRATTGTGEKCARDLGVGWKISPSVNIEAGQVFEMANIEGSGAIQHIWLTPTGVSRFSIIRFYWDGCEYPSVECPVGDFFAHAYSALDDVQYLPVSSLAVCVNPKSGLNCYWEMPFRKSCRITLENIADEQITLYYQVDYTLTDVSDDCGYFHARFRRSNPLEYKKTHVILEGVKGKGQYVGTYMMWGVNNNGWWGEGEIKFYLDGDEYPTICGTGTEDYFCGSYNFDVNKQYIAFSTPYSGFIPYAPDGLYNSQQRFSMYRWHIVDPIRFENDIKVDIQALGWRSGGRYLPLQDDISSVAYWYQTLTGEKFPPLPSRDGLEIV